MSHQAVITLPNPGYSPDDRTDDIRLEIDVRLCSNEPPAKPRQKPKGSEPSRSDLCRLAGQIFDARRARRRVIEEDFLGEPAWDMLLALYCLPARGVLMTATSLSYAAEVPQATGYRWQCTLRERGMIERDPDAADTRRQVLGLTRQGRRVLDDYLGRLYRTGMRSFPSQAE